MTVAQCGLPGVIWSNKPVVHSVLHSSYLKRHIEVCWILLTTQTNLGQLCFISFRKYFENIYSGCCFLHVFDKSKTTVTQSVLTPISSNSKVAHAVFHKFN